MKTSQLLSIIMAAMTLLACGCGTTTGLRVSGTPNAPFTARYRAGSLSGDISTNTKAGSPSTVLEMPAGEFSCDVSKKDPAAHLTVEIMQSGKSVFRAEAPPGTQGVRISQTPSGWKAETY
jgi:hypothetical protein